MTPAAAWSERPARTPRILSLLTIFAGVLYFGALAPYGIQTGEDGDLLYQSYATYRGQIPYLDFSTGYTPLYFYWHSALFHLFGPDILVTRVAMAAANVVTLVLLLTLTARLAGPLWGLLAPLLFMAMLPVFPGEFCSFNVPYPAWYDIPLWLGSIAACVAYAEAGRTRWIWLAGLLAGVSFSAKPNVGLFNLVAVSLFLLWWDAPARADRRVTRALWWLLAIGTLLGVIVVFQSQLWRRSFVLFPLPVLVIAAVLLRQARRDPAGGSFLPTVLALGLGFALPTLPWVAFFLSRLGVAGFGRDVLLLGSSYERFFTIEHRELWTRWDVAVVLLTGLAVAIPATLRRGWLRPWMPFAGVLVGAAIAAVWIVFGAPMPNGFGPSVAMRLQDLSFFLLQLVSWAGIAIVADALARRRRSPQLALLVVVAVSAPAFALAMYPRADFMHLLMVAPPALILGITMIAWIAERWRAAGPDRPAWRLASAGLFAAPLLGLAALLLMPGIGLTGELFRHYLDLPNDRLANAGLLHGTIIMDRNHRLLGPLRDISAFIDRETRPDEFVFPFPNLNLLCFLGGRLNPTPKGYFIAGYPDHATEAEIVTQMRAHMPRLVVALHDHELFVTTAPLYYFLVRDFVRSTFKPVAHIGPYLVLGREGDVLATPPALAFTAASSNVDAGAWPGLEDPNPAVRWATAMDIHAVRDPRGAAALAQRAADGDDAYGPLFLRITSEFGDERAMPPLVDIVTRDLALPRPEWWITAGTLRTEEGYLAAQALFYLAQKSVLAEFWFVREDAQERIAMLRSELRTAPALAWLRSPNLDSRLRYVAAWLAGATGDREAVPYLLTMLSVTNFDLAVTAAHSLAKLGQVAGTVEFLVSLAGLDEIYTPSILLELYARDPDHVRPVLARGLVDGSIGQREALSWIAAASRDPTLVQMVAAMRNDGSVTVSRAATAATALVASTTNPSPPARADGMGG